MSALHSVLGHQWNLRLLKKPSAFKVMEMFVESSYANHVRLYSGWERREREQAISVTKHTGKVNVRILSFSTGTAFVQFATREGAERCLEKAKCSDEVCWSLIPLRAV